MSGDPPRARRGRRRVPPASPISAVAVAVIASEPAPTIAQQVLLIAVVVIAALAVVCDALAWRLERAAQP